MECRAYGICLDSQSRGYLGKDRKVSSAAGGNLSRMHKTEETAKESRLNFMYSHLRNRTLDDQRGTNQQERLPVPKGLHFIYPLLNRGVTTAVGGAGDNARISGPKHP